MCGVSVRGFTHRASQATWCACAAWDMHGREGAAPLHMCTSKCGEVLQGEGGRDQPSRGCGEQVRGSRTGYREVVSRRDCSLQGQGTQLLMLQLNLPSPGWKSCLSFNQTQMPGASALPMRDLPEQPRAAQLN